MSRKYADRSARIFARRFRLNTTVVIGLMSPRSQVGRLALFSGASSKLGLVYGVLAIGKIRTLARDSSTLIKAPISSTDSNCFNASITKLPMLVGNTSCPRI